METEDLTEYIFRRINRDKYDDLIKKLHLNLEQATPFWTLTFQTTRNILSSLQHLFRVSLRSEVLEALYNYLKDFISVRLL